MGHAQVDRNVEREICNHRLLNHPNIIAFREVRALAQRVGHMRIRDTDIP
jgi:serine/threonine-protein kinase SRK2